MWSLRDLAGEKQQALGQLSKGKTRIAVKMALVRSVSFAAGTGIDWLAHRLPAALLPLCPGSLLDAWFIPASCDRTIRLWKTNLKGVSVVVTAWHPSGLLALCRNCHNCALASERRLCWVSSLPWDLGSLCMTWPRRPPFFLEQMKSTGALLKRAFERSWRM